ncbi:hypothetical protein GCM10008995_05340 [Halobellus salinus]|uniref:Uncharacterized protein n=1 Tax=Halobellus salinus TaxID=931585 RepID=A0A830EKM5_9EURY|nr:hypothetical protein GCM10008995_05340 [Halobellus salinus]
MRGDTTPHRGTGGCLTFDGLDTPPNGFLDEVRSEPGLVAKTVVECAFGFGFRGDVVAIVAVPAPLAYGVGAVFELLDSLTKERIGSIGCVGFDKEFCPRGRESDQ